MGTQKEKADDFKKLHIKGSPLILFNIWDAGSARTIEQAGAKAIATGSWSVAAANGFDDGEEELTQARAAAVRRSLQLPAQSFSLHEE